MSTPGLRERKKQRTRDALTDAAYALFREKGFDATTVDEIAAAVEVSPRTFFRYFASKEDLALAPLNQQLAAMLTALAARPAGESVLTALRAATVEVLEACEAGIGGFDGERFRAMQALLAENPTLRAAGPEYNAAVFDELAELVGARMGVDPTGDPRPYLVASVTLGAVRTAGDAWRVHHPEVPASRLFAGMIDLLAAGVDYPSAAGS
ncbi:TetR family transcriptional regulator [Pseudonocardia lacus]|uniref:TetR family transcriptional regulator n=1 Tax=Pseudonocardia lacus TaxID=2835865 RepID=UPI001BDC5EF2|nr:TetR family transcriptional regulator [Pseudonocardia lacus]